MRAHEHEQAAHGDADNIESARAQRANPLLQRSVERVMNVERPEPPQGELTAYVKQQKIQRPPQYKDAGVAQ